MDRIVNHSNPCLKSQPPTSWKTPSSLSGNALSKYLTVFIHIFSNHFRSYPLPQRRVYSIPHGRIAKNITSVGGLGEVDDSQCVMDDKFSTIFITNNDVVNSLTVKNFLKSGTSIINETIARIASDPVLNIPITVL